MQRFAEHTAWAQTPAEAKKIGFRLDGQPNWDNLMEWCQAVQQHKVPLVDASALSEDCLPIYLVVATAHEISEASGCRIEAWLVCLQTLGSLRRVAAGIDRRWSEDA